MRQGGDAVGEAGPVKQKRARHAVPLLFFGGFGGGGDYGVGAVEVPLLGNADEAAGEDVDG